jgi:protocatechuate 3,4-dioxygenase beta subunit
MRDFNESNITGAVIESFRQTPNARLKQIMMGLADHLHRLVSEVELKPEEWACAIEFLTRTGKMCSDKRQEFILLSDTLGVSMLVDALSHGALEGATASTVLGPFFVQGSPSLPHGADISRGLPGEALFVDGRVTSVDGRPIMGAKVDVWQSDADGYYDVQRADLHEATLRATFTSGADGCFNFWSIMPRYYPIPDDGPVGEMLRATGRHPNRPAHIHFKIGGSGFETLVTHIFDAESPYLDGDAVFGVKNSLIAEFSRERASVGPDGKPMPKLWRKLSYHFGLKPQFVKRGDCRNGKSG